MFIWTLSDIIPLVMVAIALILYVIAWIIDRIVKWRKGK